MLPATRKTVQKHSHSVLPVATVRVHWPLSCPTCVLSAALYTGLWKPRMSPRDSLGGCHSCTVSVMACSTTWTVVVPLARADGLFRTMLANSAPANNPTRSASVVQRISVFFMVFPLEEMEDEPTMLACSCVQVYGCAVDVSMERAG